MSDSPFASFQDPEVQAAIETKLHVYDQGSAYDEPPIKSNVYGQAGPYSTQATDIKVDMMISTGSAIANQVSDKAKAEYNDSQRTQQDQHERPTPPTFCVSLFQWFPIRYFAFLGGTALLASVVLDYFFGSRSFIQLFIYFYLVIFGVTVMIIEAPTWTLTRPFQLKFFFWCRLLSRMWGRAWFYLFASILCYAAIGSDNKPSEIKVRFTVVAGIYLTFISIASFLFSGMAAKKFGRIREFIAAGAEGKEREERFMHKFDELDLGGKPGTIGAHEIVRVAQQAGRVLWNSERHAIQTFLDQSCNGFVSKEDWMKQIVSQYEEKGYKQKFL